MSDKLHEWISRPDLNWCPQCEFAGKFESKNRIIGDLILCLNCGSTFTDSDTYKSLVGEIPQFRKE